LQAKLTGEKLKS